MVESACIKLESVDFRIGEFSLKNISLEIQQGEYFVITGPNGSGKTILMKLIAGLKNPDAGDIYIQGKNVTGIPPWERNIGYVPQDYALFPNRTVKRNITFGLEVRKFTKEEREKKAAETAELLGISSLMDRAPGELSGGEKQKVSIARMLVFKPSIMLLDEPVSSIDESTRDILCKELKKLHQETGITTVHISHNKHETELVADRIAFLENGAISSVTKAGD